MSVSALTLKLILILIPGGLASLVLEKLTSYSKWESFRFVVNCILLGGLSYLFSDLVFYYFYTKDIVRFWEKISSDVDTPFWEIIRATGASIFIGFIASWIENNRIITRFASKFQIAKKYGQENLYMYFLNSTGITEIYLRDIGNDLTFHGAIDSFSQNDEICEITLKDVKVYRYNDSAFLYAMPMIFLSRPKDAILIEVPILH